MRQPYKIAQRVDLDGVVHTKAGLDEHGREIADPTPIAPPIGYNKQPSMMENIRNMIRSERLRQEVEAAGAETFEEADDFDVGEDFDPTSPYEENFDPVVGLGTYDDGYRQAVADALQTAAQARTPVPPTDGPGNPADKSAAPAASQAAPKVPDQA